MNRASKRQQARQVVERKVERTRIRPDAQQWRVWVAPGLAITANVTKPPFILYRFFQRVLLGWRWELGGAP